MPCPRLHRDFLLPTLWSQPGSSRTAAQTRWRAVCSFDRCTCPSLYVLRVLHLTSAQIFLQIKGCRVRSLCGQMGHLRQLRPMLNYILLCLYVLQSTRAACLFCTCCRVGSGRAFCTVGFELCFQGVRFVLGVQDMHLVCSLHVWSAECWQSWIFREPPRQNVS